MIGRSQLLAVGAGVVLGGLYAWLQMSALRRHEAKLKQDGKSPSVAGMVPGSIMRVALLLLALVGVQWASQKFGWGLDLLWLMVSLAADA